MVTNTVKDLCHEIDTAIQSNIPMDFFSKSYGYEIGKGFVSHVEEHCRSRGYSVSQYIDLDRLDLMGIPILNDDGSVNFHYKKWFVGDASQKVLIVDASGYVNVSRLLRDLRNNPCLGDAVIVLINEDGIG